MLLFLFRVNITHDEGQKTLENKGESKHEKHKLRHRDRVHGHHAQACAAAFFGGTVTHSGGYDGYYTYDSRGRKWAFLRDASIVPLRKERGQKVGARDEYKVELVTPILTYGQDMDTLQELIRRLRKAGAFTDPQHCGIHIHLDGAPHTARSIRNWVNIIASRNDLLYKALQIEPARKRWCRELDADLVRRMNARRPKNLAQIEEIWYEGSTCTAFSTETERSSFADSTQRSTPVRFAPTSPSPLR